MSVTEQDRGRAAEVFDPDDWGACRAAIAQALADERERARAPFLAVAVDLDAQFARLTAQAMTHDDPIRRARQAGLAAGTLDAAKKIRRAAETAQ